MIGRTVSHYEVLERLGGGGMGVVYKARDTSLERFVALKFLPPEWSRDPDSEERFRREAQAASALEHPNICTIHEIGQTDEGQLFIVMAAYQGETLERKIEHGPLPVAEAVDLAAQVADGLAKAHEAGFVHRDIKPANLFVTDDGHVKILDFGLAKLAGRTQLTREGTTLGTVAYMSPEQARGEEVDPRSDIWSIGVVLYQILAGQLPFSGDSEHVVIYSILEREPVPLAERAPGVPAALAAIVERALVKSREERLSSARELAAALRGIGAGGEAATAELPAAGWSATVATDAEAPTAIRPGSATSASKSRWIVGGVAAVLLVAAALGWFLTRRPSDEPVLVETDTVLLTDIENRTADPVFDGTLHQALAIKLAESPFLALAADRETAETMEYMGYGPDEPVTLERGLEICQRQGNKAVVSGEIVPFGEAYVINLSATACVSGAVLSRHQVQAASKEGVLAALGQASTELREALGESLGSVEAFDVPIERATTASLEALKAFSIGTERRSRGLEEESIPHFRRAIALDPEFALAHARLSTVFANLGRWDEVDEPMRRAFELRDRVSRAERFYIEAAYYSNLLGDVQKADEVYETWAELYPRALVPRVNLAWDYSWLGKFDRAIEHGEIAVELGPDEAWAYRNLALAYLYAGRFDDSRGILERASGKGFELPVLYPVAYALAYLEGDAGAMSELFEACAGQPGAWLGLEAAGVAASHGRLARARELLEGEAASALEQGFEGTAAAFYGLGVRWMALYGEEVAARALADEAARLGNLESAEAGAAGLALVGEHRGASKLVERLDAELPAQSIIRDLSPPVARAALHLSRGEAEEAIAALEPVRPWERGQPMAILLRGRALLAAGDAAAAVTELERILVLRGVKATDPVHTIVYLDLARAHARAGDLEASRRSYEEFFELVAGADRGVAAIEAARHEWADLPGSN